MKQFKAEWQYNRTLDTESLNEYKTIDHLITQHNALCDYLEEQLTKKENQGCGFCGGKDFCVCAGQTGTDSQWKLPSNSGVGSGTGTGPIGKGAGYDPRYKDGKAQQTITIPKPEWWDSGAQTSYTEVGHKRRAYLEALEACIKASGINFNLE